MGGLSRKRGVRRLILASALLLATRASAGDRAALELPRIERFGNCTVEYAAGLSGEPLTTRAVPLGPRNVLVLIVDFLDKTVAATYGEPDPIGFVAGVMYDNPKNAAGAIADASWGLTTLVSDADGDLQHDIFHVNVPTNMTGAGCATTTWANLADAEALALGIDLGLYQHKMYVLPWAGSCGWWGYGQIGGSRTWIRNKSGTVYAHELGHNLGMHHASTDPDNDGVIDSEYGDFSDIMGQSSIWRQFNGPHKAQMAWLPPGAIHDLFGGGSWVFTIEALEIDPAAAIHPQIIRISRPEAPDRPYYLSYRAAIGYDQTLSSLYRNRLQVHTATGTSVQTFYITGLTDGQIYSDPLAHDLVIEQLSHDGTTVTIEVERTEPDLDEDGFGETTDCDDTDPTVYPGAPELCDHLDNNCDQVVDEGLGPCDIDQDGFDESVDCDDGNPNIFPGATEICDYLDNNCDGIADEPDYDGDGAGNCVDQCPNDPNKGGSADGSGGFFWCPCGVSEDGDEDGDTIPDCADNCPGDPDPGSADTDEDGIPDCLDQCPLDPEKWNPAFNRDCDCGVPNVDSDHDRVWDCHDLCPGEDDRIDSDLDGMPDCADLCPADPWLFAPGPCGCGPVLPDADLDTVCDPLDNCLNVPNPSQADFDEDDVGDACDCDPLDPGTTAALGPATNLRFTTGFDFEWDPPVDAGGGGLSYDVVRSPDAADFSSPSCPAEATAATSVSDTEDPALLFAYLVRVRSACGDHLGLATSEQRRTAGDCP